VTKAIALGAAIVLAVGVPIAVIGALAVDDGSNIVFLLAVPVLAAFVAGGWYAARQEPRSALVVGAAAAVAGFAIAQVVSIALQVVQDEDVNAGAVVGNALLAAACGLLGGAVARR
jgi:hypothetical protein